MTSQFTVYTVSENQPIADAFIPVNIYKFTNSNGQCLKTIVYDKTEINHHRNQVLQSKLSAILVQIDGALEAANLAYPIVWSVETRPAKTLAETVIRIHCRDAERRPGGVVDSLKTREINPLNGQLWHGSYSLREFGAIALHWLDLDYQGLELDKILTIGGPSSEWAEQAYRDFSERRAIIERVNANNQAVEAGRKWRPRFNQFIKQCSEALTKVDSDVTYRIMRYPSDRLDSALIQVTKDGDTNLYRLRSFGAIVLSEVAAIPDGVDGPRVIALGADDEDKIIEIGAIVQVPGEAGPLGRHYDAPCKAFNRTSYSEDGSVKGLTIEFRGYYQGEPVWAVKRVSRKKPYIFNLEGLKELSQKGRKPKKAAPAAPIVTVPTAPMPPTAPVAPIVPVTPIAATPSSADDWMIGAMERLPVNHSIVKAHRTEGQQFYKITDITGDGGCVGSAIDCDRWLKVQALRAQKTAPEAVAPAAPPEPVSLPKAVAAPPQQPIADKPATTDDRTAVIRRLEALLVGS